MRMCLLFISALILNLQCLNTQAIRRCNIVEHCTHIWELQKLPFCIVYLLHARTPLLCVRALCVYISLWESYKIAKWEFIIWNAGNMCMHDASNSLSLPPSPPFPIMGILSMIHSFSLCLLFVSCVCVFSLPKFDRFHSGSDSAHFSSYFPRSSCPSPLLPPPSPLPIIFIDEKYIRQSERYMYVCVWRWGSEFGHFRKVKPCQGRPIQFNTCQYINMLLYIYNFPKCSMPSKYLIKSRTNHNTYSLKFITHMHTHTEWLHALAFDFSFRWFIGVPERACIAQCCTWRAFSYCFVYIHLIIRF